MMIASLFRKSRASSLRCMPERSSRFGDECRADHQGRMPGQAPKTFQTRRASTSSIGTHAAWQRQAAFGSAPVLAKAQSSQGMSASTSAVSTVAPHQMRKPGGASRSGGDVVADAFSSRAAPRAPWRTRWASGESAVTTGSTTLRQTEVEERIGGSAARKSIQGVRATQFGDGLALASARAHQRRQAADRFRPLQRVERVLDAQHRRRVDGFALENAFVELAALGRGGRSSAAARPACRLSSRSTARGDSTSMPCAASPPSTFCQDQVTTSSLAQSNALGEDRRGGVADGEALAVRRDPVAVRHAHARGGAVPGEDHVVDQSTLARSGSSP